MENKAEQYYPTYKSKNRDILLIEFEEAQKIANSQTKVYGQVANILIAVVTIIIPLFFEQDKESKILGAVESNATLFSIILILFGGILLRYFTELQKQITINARKAVTLRTMLGLDYGSIHLTLPNWRVEGATNPFSIKYFNGWFHFQSIPFWVLTIAMNVIWSLATKNNKAIILIPETLHFGFYLGNFILSVWYVFLFRRSLNDLYETIYLNFVKIIAWLLRIKLIANFEYIIYRIKLSHIELDRLKVQYESLKKILIQIEDKNFGEKSISIKSLLRGFLSQFKLFRKKYNLLKSGGSNIKMQFVRSNFIEHLSSKNKYRRKTIEILLTFWLSNKFTNKEILNYYITSVRYEKGVLGLAEAIKYFFGELKGKILTNEESFFLIERLSNITSSVNYDRINLLLNRTILDLDRKKVYAIYDSLLRQGKLKEF